LDEKAEPKAENELRQLAMGFHVAGVDIQRRVSGLSAWLNAEP
jgi:hypothetical protein